MASWANGSGRRGNKHSPHGACRSCEDEQMSCALCKGSASAGERAGSVGERKQPTGGWILKEISSLELGAK